jgi:hypothetical protein
VISVQAVPLAPASGKHYTGAGIISSQLFRYGYYEARFKVPAAEFDYVRFFKKTAQ